MTYRSWIKAVILDAITSGYHYPPISEWERVLPIGSDVSTLGFEKNSEKSDAVRGTVIGFEPRYQSVPLVRVLWWPEPGDREPPMRIHPAQIMPVDEIEDIEFL